MPKKTPCRFYARRRDNGPARSSVWRIWTGKNGQDVYIAPSRIAGDFKLSIHRDGWNQLGFYSPRVRGQIRAADKHYLSRWKRQPAPFITEGWNTLCMITFNSDEFEVLEVPDSTNSKPVVNLIAPPPEMAGHVIVLQAEDRASAHDLGLVTLAEFPSGERGAIAIVGAPAPFDPLRLAAVDADQSIGWEPPATPGVVEPFGFVFSVGAFPEFIEYSTNRHSPPPLVPRLSGLKADVSLWADAPPEYQGTPAFCGVLACDADGRNATLYVAPRSHCTHHHLVSDTNDLITAMELGRRDDQWGQLSDGRWATGITMAKTADSFGMTGYRGNPMKPDATPT